MFLCLVKHHTSTEAGTRSASLTTGHVPSCHYATQQLSTSEQQLSAMYVIVWRSQFISLMHADQGCLHVEQPGWVHTFLQCCCQFGEHEMGQ